MVDETNQEEIIQDTTSTEEDTTQQVQASEAQVLASKYGISEGEAEAKIQEAKTWGHTPRDQYTKGDDRWMDPVKYLDARQNNVQSLRHQIKQMKGTMDNLVELNKNAYERGYKEREQSINAGMKQAVEEGDQEAVNRLRVQEKDLYEEKNKLKAPVEEAKDNQENGLAIQQWIELHPQFNTDSTFKNMAEGEFYSLRLKYPSAQTHHILEALDVKINNDKRSRVTNVNPVESSTAKKPEINKRSYQNLTKRAMEACSEAERQGLSKDIYVKNATDSCFVWNK